uniref:Uncharacterized protein n=1 Tax=Rhizophora mucronata TaxID=61149 RepID=A0A2P2IKP4_RHIMU
MVSDCHATYYSSMAHGCNEFSI